MIIYRYVGSHEIKESLSTYSHRHKVTSQQGVITWLANSEHPINVDGTITLTFIVDTEGLLWVNDRHSEHILCANGGEVLSAGEMTFEVKPDSVSVVAVTNQSTGYCPQPESYPVVKKGLEQTDIPHPSHFTTAYHFRLCDQCGTTNIIKDDWYVCAVCDSDLSQTWNYG